MNNAVCLVGLCLCPDARDCWHGPCRARRLPSGKVVLENQAGHVMLAQRGQVDWGPAPAARPE